VAGPFFVPIVGVIVRVFALQIRRVLSDYVEGPTLCGALAALICLLSLFLTIKG
jgi:hypothetical protein